MRTTHDPQPELGEVGIESIELDLRSRDDIVVRVGCGGASVQVRVRDAPDFPDDGGLSVIHDFGLRMPHTMRRMIDFWSAAGRSSPRSGRVRREASGRNA